MILLWLVQFFVTIIETQDSLQFQTNSQLYKVIFIVQYQILFSYGIFLKKALKKIGGLCSCDISLYY